MDFKAFAVIFCLFLGGSECSRILIAYPTITVSHVLPLQSLAKALVTKGHHITFLSPVALSKPINNYREIKLPFNEADRVSE